MSTVDSAVLTPTDLEPFRDLVRERSGIDLPPQRLPELERAMRRVMEETGERDPGRLASLLADRPRGLVALESLIGRITVGETYFFRHPQQFEALERRILPELMDARRGVRRLRVWSAGCASGEEPYSVAILLDRVAPALAGWNTTVLATDIHRGALESARRGRYRAWSLRGVPAAIRQTYFDPVGEDLEILPRFRQTVRFEYQNLVEDPYPTLLSDTNAVDLILCRNVLIYLTEDAIARVVDRLVAALAEGGWLLLGPSDPRPRALDGLSRHLVGDAAIAYRKEARSTPAPPILPPAPAITAMTPVASATAPRSHPAPTGGPSVKMEAEDLGTPVEAETLCAEAATLAGSGDLEGAERLVRLAVDRDPLLAAAHWILGLVLDERGDREGALDALRRCTYLEPDSPLGHLALAGLLGRLGGSERALRELDVARALATNLPPEELLPGGDGLTAGRLLEMVEAQRELHRSDPTRSGRG